MKKLLISCLLIFLFPSQVKAQQNRVQPPEQPTLPSTASQATTQRIKEANTLLRESSQSYSSGNFEAAERSLKQIVFGTFREEFDQPPNLDIPNPGGVRESHFVIPGVFEYHNSYTVPSEVIWLEPQRRVSFDSLFAAITTRVSRNSLNLAVSDVATAIHSRLWGCLYFGNSGGRSCMTSTTGESPRQVLQNLFPNSQPFFQIGDGLPEMDRFSPSAAEAFGSINNIHSISKDTLNLLQKSLVAQGGREKLEEALIFAEQSRNMELVRIAPIALYGMVNHKEIASNSRYSRFFSSAPFTGIDLKSIRKIASREKATIVYYSTVAAEEERELFIWVVQPSGNILFRKVDLSGLNTSLKATVNSTLIAASSFIDRGQQKTALIQAIRDLRTQSSERLRTRVEDFLIEEATQKQQLQYLHSLLIEPIEELLPEDPNAHVIFVPQSDLAVVPFAALQDREGRYLIEKHTIRTTYSFANLKRRVKPIREMPSGGDEVLMVGNPYAPNLDYDDGSTQILPLLPSAELEAVGISNSLNGAWFIRDAASLRRISPFLSKAKIIHFAAHGLQNYASHREFMLVQQLEGDKNSSLHIQQANIGRRVNSNLVYRVWYDQKSADMRWQVIQARLSLTGAIALAESYLTAEQILSMRLKADLVILSACNTGQGVATESGILGLPFAFGLAGVPRVTVSIWSVPDTSTELLMVEYYKAMGRNAEANKDADPAKSLREAMLAVKSRDVFRDPIHWAGFTVMNVSY